MPAVIFDMDGVLTDSEPLICAAAMAMFAEIGVTVQPGDFRPFVGAGENRYLGGVAERHGVRLDLPRAKQRTYELYLEMVPHRLRVFPGAVELVHGCRRAGWLTAVASGADRVKVNANLNLIGLPVAAWDALVCGEEVARGKPAPDIFLAVARKLEMTPAQCVVIEDAVNGVQAALAAGMGCLAVAQTFRVDQLAAAHRIRPVIADVTMTDLEEVVSRGPVFPAETPDPNPRASGQAPACC